VPRGAKGLTADGVLPNIPSFKLGCLGAPVKPQRGGGKVKGARVSCRSFAANAVRLQLHALAYNLGNFLRTLATPEPIKDWSLTSLKEKLIKIGAKVVSHGRYVAFQMAEVAIPRSAVRRRPGGGPVDGPRLSRARNGLRLGLTRRPSGGCRLESQWTRHRASFNQPNPARTHTTVTSGCDKAIGDRPPWRASLVFERTAPCAEFLILRRYSPLSSPTKNMPDPTANRSHKLLTALLTGMTKSKPMASIVAHIKLLPTICGVIAVSPRSSSIGF